MTEFFKKLCMYSREEISKLLKENGKRKSIPVVYRCKKEKSMNDKAFTKKEI